MPGARPLPPATAASARAPAQPGLRPRRGRASCSRRAPRTPPPPRPLRPRAPAPAAPPGGAGRRARGAGAPSPDRASATSNDSNGNWIWSNNGEKLQVSYSGSFEFTDDDTDVRQISPGGYLKISDGAWLGRHSVEIRERGGQLDRRYYVNASERPYEPEGRQWLHDEPAEVRAQHRHRRAGARRALPEVGRRAAP